jgi:IS30 family transposase
MGTNYCHLSLGERERINCMLYESRTVSEIALALGRHKSTISRELHRNASPECRYYLAHRAQERTECRRGAASQRPRLKNDLTREYVLDKLQNHYWSPEAIAGRIELDHPGLSLSHEAIYQYIYDRNTPNRSELILCLRRTHRKRRPQGPGRKERKTKIPNRISIEHRPKAVADRRQFGHWEGDTMVSRRSPAALYSLVERKSRLLLLTKLDRRGANETNAAVISRLGMLPDHARRTLTLDNGTEHAGHEKITQAIGTRCYFCHPYASYERGGNENANGLVRWYLPKGTDFSNVSDEQIAQVELAINSRPRKCLGFRTSMEVATHSVALRS